LQEPELSGGAARGAWARLALFVTVAMLAFAAVVIASRAMPAPERVAFDNRTVKRLRKLNPDIVLLGNSMVGSRFHERTLNRKLAPKRVAVVGVAGTKSAAWYLMLKNQVFAASQPKRVVIFFYGNEITAPRARALGREHWLLERASPAEDPLVDRKLRPHWDEPVARLSWLLGRAVPVDRFRRRYEGISDQWATKVSEWVHPEPDLTARKSAINDLFELDNLRSAGAGPDRELDVNVRLMEAEKRPFAKVVKRSFLPNMLALAKQAGTHLTFVHIRLREVAAGEALPPVYARYLHDVEQYLRAHGAEFVDMGPNQWEDVGFYGEGSHLAHRFRPKYSRLFARNMSSLFE
jgi:hypothetical protein